MWFLLRNALKNYLKFTETTNLKTKELFQDMSSSLKVFQLQTVDLEHNLLAQFPLHYSRKL